MNAQIDEAIKGCLEGVTALSAFDFFCGISDSELPEKGSCVIVSTQTADHAAGGYFRATVQVQVVTEALHATSMTTHNNACDAVRAYLLNGPMSSDWESTALTFHGRHLASTQQQVEERRFIFVAELVIGVRAI